MYDVTVWLRNNDNTHIVQLLETIPTPFSKE